ncbi:NADH dehydrogenase [ubiquinone] 1 alpha subcomplex assembly factor 2 isoform X3 [Calypte anna]|uniref:NADH dehydrogenase [ubiquinone] 1 alpha subcomplex assembly factor 2 isoform X3 n=1 Tax=Calypte anna TaxID=9244 RepID=UPI0011C4561C|nr:NADH dehydrogenase [ubiquinone] 1 alpha subcomplex assembly factor 2 isoform X3 [Calypte anna]
MLTAQELIIEHSILKNFPVGTFLILEGCSQDFSGDFYRLEQPQLSQPLLIGRIIPERRYVEAINRQAYQYEMGDFPTEWEAWIRKKRNDPPTIQFSAMDDRSCQTAQAFMSYEELCDQTLTENIIENIHKSSGQLTDPTDSMMTTLWKPVVWQIL